MNLSRPALAASSIAVLFCACSVAQSELDRLQAPPAVSASLSGHVMAGVTAADVCRPGWASAHRHYDPTARSRIEARDGRPAGSSQVDHVVPLELGGVDADSNMQLQPYPEATAKDHVENAAHDAVCSGRLSLSDAQARILADWRGLGAALGVT